VQLVYYSGHVRSVAANTFNANTLDVGSPDGVVPHLLLVSYESNQEPIASQAIEKFSVDEHPVVSTVSM